MRTVRVSEKGQVVLPVEVRRAMNIQRGDALVLVCDGERLLLQKEAHVAKAVEEDFADLAQASEQVLKGVWENDDDAVWDAV